MINFFCLQEYVEDIPTPISRGLVYNILKEFEENESPLSKRRRLENVTDSPIDMSGIKIITLPVSSFHHQINSIALDPPDYFEMIDRKFIEIPKTRQSTVSLISSEPSLNCKFIFIHTAFCRVSEKDVYQSTGRPI